MHRRTLHIAVGLVAVLAVAAALVTANQSPDASCPAGACASCPNHAACADAQPAAATKVPVVDAAKCTGCTRCTIVAPKTFAMTKDGSKARVINPTGDSPELIKSAADGCRPRAITYR